MNKHEPTREELVALIHSLIHQGSALHNDVFRRNEGSTHASGWRALVNGVQQATDIDYGVRARYHRLIEFKKERPYGEE